MTGFPCPWEKGAGDSVSRAILSRQANREELEQEYREQFAHPYVAASRGYIDDVIEPQETRPRIIAALKMLEHKRDTNPPKKHGNIPL